MVDKSRPCPLCLFALSDRFFFVDQVQEFSSMSSTCDVSGLCIVDIKTGSVFLRPVKQCLLYPQKNIHS